MFDLTIQDYLTGSLEIIQSIALIYICKSLYKYQKYVYANFINENTDKISNKIPPPLVRSSSEYGPMFY